VSDTWNSKPADEFLADMVKHVNNGFAEMFEDRQAKRDAAMVKPEDTIMVLEAGVTVYRWGLVYALLTLQRYAPDQFEAFAKDLQEAWDAGDSLGEWSWQWADEMKRGADVTLPFAWRANS
jgi:hypothetical protein